MGFMDDFAQDVATARTNSYANTKKKKKNVGGAAQPDFLNEIEAAKGFSGEFRKLARERVKGWIGSLLGI